MQAGEEKKDGAELEAGLNWFGAALHTRMDE